MNEEELKELISRGNRAAFLLGQICARLNIIIEEAHAIVYGDKLPGDLKELWQDIMYQINEIYYNKKEEHNDGQ